VIGANLDSNARNLKSFLSKLFTSGSGKIDQVRRYLKSAFPEIEDIIIPIESGITLGGGVGGGSTNPLTDIRLKLSHFKPEKTTDAISLKYCGTGIEQYLAIITAIITAEEPHLFLIDEPHSFLHPYAEKKLIELISENLQHQYVISTHSPTILNSIDPKSIRLLKRKEEDGSVFCGDYDINEAISELGLTPSDLWFYQRIIFVEGATEEKILPIILYKLFEGINLNKIKIADLNDQASAMRGSRKRRQIHSMVKIAIEAVSPFKDEFAIEYLFLLDGEGLPNTEIEKLKDDYGDKIIFTNEPEIENYLLDVGAIYKVLLEECEQYEVDKPSGEAVSEKLVSLKTENRKGSDVLQKLFGSYDLNYEKTKHGPLIANELTSDYFGEFRLKLESFIN